jgi:hypothetical protein
MSRDSREEVTKDFGIRNFTRKPSAEELQNAKIEAKAIRDAVPAKPSDISLADAAKTISISDFKRIHEMPCHRQGYMTGIAGGATVGVIRYISGGMVGEREALPSSD